MPQQEKKQELHWIRRPRNIRRFWICGIIILTFVTIIDFFIPHQPHFGLDGTFGFYSWYGLLACAIMVVIAKILGLILKREDSYYDD